MTVSLPVPLPGKVLTKRTLWQPRDRSESRVRMGKGIEVHPMLRCGGAADRIDFRELDFRELDFRELDFRESGAD